MPERSAHLGIKAVVAVAGGALVLAGALAASTALGLIPAPAPLAKFAYDRPGRLVTLPDHRRLNFRCQGEGSPTVILESGFGATSQGWNTTQPRIAARTRVCAYDRAGYGFSDPGPAPRDGAAIARDLDNGLKAAGIAGPYVVVGHSAGGLYARLFAARRPREVVGLVFVDSSVEHQAQRLEATFGPGAGSLDGLERRTLKCLKLTSEARTPADDPGLLECAPPKADAHSRQLDLQPATWRTQLSELENLFTTTSDEVDRVGTLLQEVPAIVLTAGKADGVAAAPDDPAGATWQAFHRDLAKGFLRGEQRTVKSSHLMMVDRPDVVAGAAIELVEAARKR
jgi:pimeloyl-ACP methyl ester carboxylesterase